MDNHREPRDLISTIAHDLRQPLGAIALAADVLQRLRRGQLLPAEEKVLARLKTAADDMDRLIEQMTEAFRIEARRLELNSEPIDLRTWLFETVTHRDASARARPIVLSEGDAVPKVRADAARLAKVVDTLIAAASVAADGDGELRIGLTRREQDLEFEIECKGLGLTPDELRIAFSGSFKRNLAEDRTPRGLGLALYIAQGVIEAHGGRIWATSVPGQTTSFCFTLPVQRD